MHLRVHVVERGMLESLYEAQERVLSSAAGERA